MSKFMMKKLYLLSVIQIIRLKICRIIFKKLHMQATVYTSQTPSLTVVVMAVGW